MYDKILKKSHKSTITTSIKILGNEGKAKLFWMRWRRIELLLHNSVGNFFVKWLIEVCVSVFEKFTRNLSKNSLVYFQTDTVLLLNRLKVQLLIEIFSLTVRTNMLSNFILNDCRDTLTKLFRSYHTDTQHCSKISNLGKIWNFFLV